MCSEVNKKRFCWILLTEMKSQITVKSKKMILTDRKDEMKDTLASELPQPTQKGPPGCNNSSATFTVSCIKKKKKYKYINKFTKSYVFETN